MSILGDKHLGAERAPMSTVADVWENLLGLMRPPHWLKRQLARLGYREQLLPEQLAHALGLPLIALEDYILRGRTLSLSDDALRLLHQDIGVPVILLRVASGELQLRDLVSTSGLGQLERQWIERHSPSSEHLDWLLLAGCLGGAQGDAPRSL